MNINASIIGANGYTGVELINILINHPNVSLNYLVSRSNEGKKLKDLYPSYTNIIEKDFSDLDVDRISKNSDIVFLALPHGMSAEIAGKIFDKGTKVIDLSADFRYDDLSVYKKWYHIENPRPELNEKAIYGLPELYRNKIRKSKIIANPGCYTTCSILPLFPLLKNKVISPKNIIIDAKSGITGAGRKAILPNIFSEVSENFKAYSLTNHRHTSEIEEQLSKAYGKNILLSFSPHLLPVKRGILTTIYANIDNSDIDFENVYKEFYKNETFVHILEQGILPELKNVVGSNNIQIGFTVDKRLKRLIIVSCLDNLIKGASGQAVQNMNIMFDLQENLGLNMIARYI